MSMKAAVDEVNAAVQTALNDATTAFDDLVDELKKKAPDSATVLDHSGKVWTSSLKAWAQLMLAPAKIAAAISSEGA